MAVFAEDVACLTKNSDHSNRIFVSRRIPAIERIAHRIQSLAENLDAKRKRITATLPGELRA